LNASGDERSGGCGHRLELLDREFELGRLGILHVPHMDADDSLNEAARAVAQMSRSKRSTSALIVSGEAFPRSRPRRFVKATLRIER
jgi:hypothetical protein